MFSPFCRISDSKIDRIRGTLTPVDTAVLLLYCIQYSTDSIAAVNVWVGGIDLTYISKLLMSSMINVA